MTNQLLKLAVATLHFCALAACAIVPSSVPGKTGASPVLQRDVLQIILPMDRGLDKDCNQRKIVNTEILITPTSANGFTAVEHWTLDRCGKPIPYQVTMRPSPRGGTDFTVGQAADTKPTIVPSTVTVPGKTVASPVLQRDILQSILILDSHADKDCNQRKIINTEILGIFETRLGTKDVLERWTLDRCGKIIPYQVKMMPGPLGGTHFNVDRGGP